MKLRPLRILAVLDYTKSFGNKMSFWYLLLIDKRLYIIYYLRINLVKSLVLVVDPIEEPNQ